MYSFAIQFNINCAFVLCSQQNNPANWRRCVVCGWGNERALAYERKWDLKCIRADHIRPSFSRSLLFIFFFFSSAAAAATQHTGTHTNRATATHHTILTKLNAERRHPAALYALCCLRIKRVSAHAHTHTNKQHRTLSSSLLFRHFFSFAVTVYFTVSTHRFGHPFICLPVFMVWVRAHASRTHAHNDAEHEQRARTVADAWRAVSPHTIRRLSNCVSGVCLVSFHESYGVDGCYCTSSVVEREKNQISIKAEKVLFSHLLLVEFLCVPSLFCCPCVCVSRQCISLGTNSFNYSQKFERERKKRQIEEKKRGETERNEL